MAKIDHYLRSNLKLRHLQLLVTLDEMRHIGKVANYLNVTQPAISKTLADFEEGLNIKLFDRTTRGMLPTEAGVCLVKYAKKILNEIASARDDLVAISEGRATRIAIGLLPAVSLSILPNFIARVENEMVSTSINAREGSSDVLISLLRTGELDVMIGNLAAKPLGIEFRTKHLYKDPIVVVVKKGHPLVTKQDLVWTDLSEFPMVLPPEFATTRIVIEEFLLCHQVNLSKRYVESLSTLTNIGVLLATESIGFLSFQLADYFKKANLVDILPLKMKNIYIDIGLVWYTERKLTPTQLNIISMLEDTVCISNLKQYKCTIL
ncbi:MULTISPECIES: LysR substrate-binding domain-containing protein [Acinetobacter]|uniref:LysR substrate-binding domain-containing protein n=1 Tax=Acinetobacter TaxID=469 RepID=UPI00141B619C|nr:MULTISPECIES: LysR substrate-binding domain-containing protein [Acinetobacter]MCS4299523.1 DNA-binding transcriptional LysR family regulator [Acinetobacter guillouiae]MCW2252896.1 DNA-binding transcriptional LysR family regulator [Acinetobacter sp. BIGb0204]NII36336.1 DNA-binding transcriptional LysR family regulator [Acinetobacter sp. BIGb0196]